LQLAYDAAVAKGLMRATKVELVDAVEGSASFAGANQDSDTAGSIVTVACFLLSELRLPFLTFFILLLNSFQILSKISFILRHIIFTFRNTLFSLRSQLLMDWSA